MNTEKIKYGFVCMMACLLMPVGVFANVVWPSLYIAEGVTSWYVILCGLIVEAAFVKIFLKYGYLKSVLVAFVMNLVSTVLGIVAIPVSGLGIEIIMLPFGTGTFSLIHWILNYIVAILLNVIIEGLTVKFVFRRKFRKMFSWLFAANAISIIICILFHGFTMQNIQL